jgi:hypothetical protein
MTKITREEHKLFDAQADHEAWSLAHEFLEPWVRTTRPIGSDELTQVTQVMEKALAQVEMDLNRTRDVLGSLQAGMAPHEYVVSELACSRGLAGLEELKERLRVAGYNNTADKLLEGPGRIGRARQRDPAIDRRGAGAHRLGLCADIFLS